MRSDHRLIVALAFITLVSLVGCQAVPPNIGRYNDTAVGEAKRVHAPLTPDDEFLEALDLVARLEYAEAAARFEPLVVRFEEFENRRRAAESVFWIGYCREKQDRTAEAAENYRRVLVDYADTPAAAQAEARLSRLAQVATPDH